MPIYTRKGDDGTTGLLGKKRALKTDPLFEAIGTVDELNAALGICISLTGNQKDLNEIKDNLLSVQDKLFSIGSNLARPSEEKDIKVPERPTQKDIDKLEAQIDIYTKQMPPLQNFILPGGHPLGAQLQLARSVCRRAERRMFATQANLTHKKYINRLSDYLFTLSRFTNFVAKQTETKWNA